MMLVDVDGLVRDGVIGPEQAEEMRQRARTRLVALVVEVLLVIGVAAVVGGTSFLLDDAGAIAVFGAVVTVAALVALRALGPAAALVGNAAAAIGVAMLVIGGGLRLDELAGAGAVAAFGLAVGLLGVALLLRGGPQLRFAAAVMILAGTLAHLFGLLALEPDAAWAPLVLLYAGALLVAVGAAVDLRPATFLAGLSLALVPGARGLFSPGSGGGLLVEPALTILFLSAVGCGAYLWALRAAPRWARHASTLALSCFLGINLAFWAGSIWGDVIGLHLWGPRWEVWAEGGGSDGWEAWRAAQAAFEARALVLPAWVFSVGWAVLIVAVGIRAALGLRRETVNMAATFGALHAFTQYFRLIEATPGAIALAGLIAIAAAAGLWRLNRALPGRRAGGARDTSSH